MRGRWQAWATTPGNPVDVSGSLAMPATFSMVFVPADRDPKGPAINIDYEVVDGRMECRELRISASPGGAEVRRQHLAEISIEDLLEAAVKKLGFLRHEDGLMRWVDSADFRRAAAKATRGTRRRVGDELLQEVAEVYRANVSSKPTEAVSEHFDVAHRTAAHYIEQARSKQFLGAAVRGKAGEAGPPVNPPVNPPKRRPAARKKVSEAVQPRHRTVEQQLQARANALTKAAEEDEARNKGE